MWGSIGAAALTVLYAVIFILYHHATYDSICFNTNSSIVSGYVLQAIYPDLETAEVFLIDTIQNAFSQESLVSGYPMLETSVDTWPSPLMDDIRVKFNIDLARYGIALKQYRTHYHIDLSQDMEFSMDYHYPEIDMDPRPIYDIHVFVRPLSETIPYPPANQLQLKPFIHIGLKSTNSLSEEEAVHLFGIIETAITAIKKCQ